MLLLIVLFVYLAVLLDKLMQRLLILRFFPAAGLRRNTTGNVEYRGFGGAYWSSSVGFTSTAWRVWFNAVYVDLVSDVRTFGFSVRCVAQ